MVGDFPAARFDERASSYPLARSFAIPTSDREERTISGYRQLGFSSYYAYLQSPHWLTFKARYNASGRSKKCAICKSRKTQLHHRTYERLGSERLDDVIPLCQEHHESVHLWLDHHGLSEESTDLAVLELQGIGTGKIKKKLEKQKNKPRPNPKATHLCECCKVNESKKNEAFCGRCQKKKGIHSSQVRHPAIGKFAVPNSAHLVVRFPIHLK